MGRLLTLLLTFGLCGAAWAQADEDAPVPDTVPEASKLQVASLTFGASVVDRRLQGEGQRFRVGEQVVAYAIVGNRGAKSDIEMIWQRDGKEVWRTTLTIGRSKAWRTWSRFTLRKGGAGPWTVLITAGAEVLAKSTFTAQAAAEADR